MKSLLCILIFLCGCATKDTKIYEYRLGDMVTSKRNRDLDSGQEYHFKNFPDSIASEYMRRTPEQNRFDILLNIVKERSKAEHYPPKDRLIIHLRVGDVIDQTPHMAKDFLAQQIYYGGTDYVRPLSYFEKVLEEAKKRDIHSVTLIAGFHMPLKSHNKSLAYIRLVGEFFEANGMQVTQRIDEPADEDVLYICNAKFYTPSGGGFSRVMKEAIKLSGGTIIEPK